MLTQRFIELGEGYGDVYELCELIKTNQTRLHRAFLFTSTTPGGKTVLSIAAAFHPAAESKFMPIYICREGIGEQSKRKELFLTILEEVGVTPVSMELKHSSIFAESDLYYQYITGILRLNYLLPPLQ